MPKLVKEKTIATTKVLVRQDAISDFAHWQAKLNSKIAAFPGFVSLEILSPIEKGQPAWVIVQRFNHPEKLAAWYESQERLELIEELSPLLIKDNINALVEDKSETSNVQECVTEVFVTQVSKDSEQAYRKWMAKIHQEEAKFPGFKGVYVQSPSKNQGNWITLLQFDTPEHLDLWLASPEREKVLEESKSLIESLESHRVVSPYAGWFSSLAKTGKLPSAWKQSMIVLLVLFPIVMLELKFLPYLIGNLNRSLGTFIGNAISVMLIAWPMTPIAIWFLGWWLSPKETGESKLNQITFKGTALILLLYLIEIAIFWNLL